MGVLAAYQKDCLKVNIFEAREEMALQAAAEVLERLHALCKEKDSVSVMFGSAPSQSLFLEALLQDKTLPWDKMIGFHMDEYLGLPKDAPQGFGNFLRDALFSRAPFRHVYYLDGQTEDPQGESARYAALLREHPLDMVCLGIGENGHIAFNDPHVADFFDPNPVKVVTLDEQCRQQQVNDGCFPTLDQVPRQAITVTIPQMMAAPWAFCVAPFERKAQAVYNTVNSPIGEAVPATVLRVKRNASLFIDAESGSLLLQEKK